MSQPGLGVMIGLLGGNEESAKIFRAALGKTIAVLSVTEHDELHFTFEDGSKMKLFDDGQSCCERRYMHTDDDLSSFVGAKLLGAEVREGPGIEEGEYYDNVKESAFLIVSTDKGQFTVVNYNEHNGYYGGFLIRAAAIGGR